MTRDTVPRILIVDDETIVAESCRRILAAEGLTVTVSHDAASALQTLSETGPFDLMICDIKMPGRDGFQLIRDVRRRCGSMAFLVMTGYLTAETVAAGKSSGAEGFVAKPFTPEELLAAVWKTIGRPYQNQTPGGNDE